MELPEVRFNFKGGKKAIAEAVQEIGKAIFTQVSGSVQAATAAVVPSVPDMVAEIVEDLNSGPISRFEEGLKKVDTLINKFGVDPNKVIDVQALAGDSSDNVPGIPGVGVKTAAELINKYGSLEKLLDKVKEIKQPKRREAIIQNEKKAILSKKLVTLKKDVPVKEKIDEFVLKKIDKTKLYDFLREMEFNRLLSSAISLYGEPKLINNSTEIKTDKNFQEINTNNYFLITNPNEIDIWVNEAEEIGEVAVDTETSSLDPHQADLVGISLCSKIGKACYVPIGHNSNKCID